MNTLLKISQVKHKTIRLRSSIYVYIYRWTTLRLHVIRILFLLSYKCYQDKMMITKWIKPAAANQTLRKMQDIWASRILLLVRRRLKYCSTSGNDMRRRARRKRSPVMEKNTWLMVFIKVTVRCYVLTRSLWAHKRVKLSSRFFEHIKHIKHSSLLSQVCLLYLK